MFADAKIQQTFIATCWSLCKAVNEKPAVVTKLMEIGIAGR